MVLLGRIWMEWFGLEFFGWNPTSTKVKEKLTKIIMR